MSQSVNYAFVHQEVRTFAFENPDALLGMVSVPEGKDALARIWNMIAEALGDGSKVSGGDFATWVKPLPDGGTLGILKPPKADAWTDAALVGLALGPMESRLLFFKKRAYVRYFTLEISMSMGDGEDEQAQKDEKAAASNVLCEWRTDGETFGHVNYGVGLESVEPDKFAALVARTMKGELAPEAGVGGFEG